MYRGNKLLVSLLFGAVTFGCCWVYRLAKVPVRKRITPWRLWHEAVSVLGMIVFIDLCNFLVFSVVFHYPISLERRAAGRRRSSYHAGRRHGRPGGHAAGHQPAPPVTFPSSGNRLLIALESCHLASRAIFIFSRSYALILPELCPDKVIYHILHCNISYITS